MLAFSGLQKNLHKPMILLWLSFNAPLIETQAGKMYDTMDLYKFMMNSL